LVLATLAALKNELSEYWVVWLVLALSALALLWLARVLKRNERLELNVLGKHLIVVRKVQDEPAARHERQASARIRADEESVTRRTDNHM